MNAPLRFENIGKDFPGVRALDGVSFEVPSGSVHALLGENGAGKSTLLKILSGVYTPSTGTLLLDGEPKRFGNTASAIEAGIAVIYQELQLVPDVSVAENLFLGHLPNTAGFVNRKALLAESERHLRNLGEDIDPRTKLGALPIGQRQMVEIAKALTREATVIAFDEPTSSLSKREVRRLFDVIQELKSQGKIILYVTHRMEEVFQICDSATVLRDGMHVQTIPDISQTTQDEIVKLMVGRSIDDIFGYKPRPVGEILFQASGVEGPGLSGPASLEVRSGEVVGLFGLVGAGRTELLRLLYGANRRTSGKVMVEGREVPASSPAESIRAGLVFCPEDRKKEGIVPIRSVQENVNLSGRRHFSPLGFFISEAKERENAQKHVERLAVRTPTLQQLLVNLSGGNQQKVILARWLSEDVKVILLDEPTRGIDVGAKREIYEIIYGLAEQGVAVVVVSSELPEVLGVSDRVLVMRQGQIVADLNRDEADQETALKHALPLVDTA